MAEREVITNQLPMLIRFLTLVFVACVALSTGACFPKNGTATTDRQNPDAVLRAYFKAWNRNDVASQKSFMVAKYADADWYPEPIESVTLVSARPLDPKDARLWSTGASEATRTYVVIFDYNPRGQGFSMKRGRYTWTYTMTWDAQRASWLISNYGAG